MDRTRWIIFAAIVLVVMGGLVAFSSKDRIDVSNVDANAIATEGDAKDHVYGNPDADVVLMEYADFQCPGCGGAYPNLQAIKEDYKDQLAFVYRHFPLRSIHPNAFAASAVSEAASSQGKFWEMHSLIYERQTEWRDLRAEQRGAAFVGYANEVGLDIEQFNTDLASDAVTRKINHDEALGKKIGVHSTPTVFLNGEQMSDEVITDLIQGQGDLLRSLIETAITEAGGTLPETNSSNE